ncbi:MAG: nucleotidyltransferase domain-containing protein [Deferribacteres bacterium]|nr:nucleotidyltransferase domain-containing protein [Deferribacteres bacterium]
MTERKAFLRDHLTAVYLFGSTAKGREREKSDLDLAFVFDEDIYRKEPFLTLQEAEMTAVEVGAELQKLVDVIILNGASLSFAYHTVRNGMCIYERDTAGRILYEVALDSKYQDFMPFIKELRETKRKALFGRD